MGGIHSSLRNSEDDGIACPDVIGQADTGLIEENAHGAFENPGAAPCTCALGIGDMRLVYVALHHAAAQDEHRQGQECTKAERKPPGPCSHVVCGDEAIE
ncbi:hypothetical protein D3C84_1100530 [compost metagenome]